MSFNNPASLSLWAENEGFQFELWQDQDKELAVHYGAANPSSLVPSRVTFLLDKSGNVLLEYTKNIDVGAHPAEVLEDCRLLFGED